MTSILHLHADRKPLRATLTNWKLVTLHGAVCIQGTRAEVFEGEGERDRMVRTSWVVSIEECFTGDATNTVAPTTYIAHTRNSRYLLEGPALPEAYT